jgi:phosphoglycolate phosphatase-like HAD superfamily hydrolase
VQPTVIFDFDGTLADTFVASIRIFEKLTSKADPYNEEEILRLRGLTAFNVVRELRIRPWRVPWLLVRGRAMMRREIETIIVFEGIEDVLNRLQDAGVPMYIISSNSPGNIRKLLQRRGLDHYFKHIYGNVGIFGKSKMLRRVIKRNRLDLRSTYYVGDEGRDIEAAKRVGVTSVAVAWGFNSAELLAKHHPAVLAHTPAELSEHFNKMLH